MDKVISKLKFVENDKSEKYFSWFQFIQGVILKRIEKLRFDFKYEPLRKIATANNACNPALLNLPDNGKAWNQNSDNKKWELECEENFKIEKGQLVLNLN